MLSSRAIPRRLSSARKLNASKPSSSMITYSTLGEITLLMSRLFMEQLPFRKETLRSLKETLMLIRTLAGRGIRSSHSFRATFSSKEAPKVRVSLSN